MSLRVHSFIYWPWLDCEECMADYIERCREGYLRADRD